MSANRSPRRHARRMLTLLACGAIAASLGACADARQMTVGMRKATIDDAVPAAAAIGGEQRSLTSNVLAQTRSAAGAGQATLATTVTTAPVAPTTSPAAKSPATPAPTTAPPAPAPAPTTTTIPAPKGMEQFHLDVQVTGGSALVKACNDGAALRVQNVPTPAVTLELRNSKGVFVLVKPGTGGDPIGFGPGQCVGAWPAVSTLTPGAVPTTTTDAKPVPSGSYTLVATWAGSQDGVAGTIVTAQAPITIG